MSEEKTDVTSLAVNWNEMLRLGGLTLALGIGWATLQVQVAQSHVEIRELKVEQKILSDKLVTMKDAQNDALVTQTEILTEMRADIRYLKERAGGL